jgi:hypothetical protein
MLINGFALGFLTFLGWASVWHKLPPAVQKWTAKHSFLIDLLTTVATYMALGGTVTALFAAAWVGILFECYMYMNHHEEDFTWLWDIIALAKRKLVELRDIMKARNDAYKAAQTA